MTELVSHYLGNITTDAALEQRVHQALHRGQCLELYLDERDRVKGRIHAQARSGESIGIIKDRSWSLKQGDVFAAKAGKLLLVHLQNSGMLVLDCSGIAAGYELALIHFGHTLGNHHCPISIRDQKIYIQLQDNRALIESLIDSFAIPGLEIAYDPHPPALAAIPPHSSIPHYHDW
ncbi:urease accessory protein UreE [Romeria aff. gracilis LEGE 07310]|uniref:Urease accessory protein UreE n=1 Tax=Vasconcelosia minhoensis LEGE 07310 TaxID=915328 RepID=A0A8J7AMF1_9CYAN|nr:urease accessory protein UreE [Romeria gracilis]MBE9077139.1 urease accessory protein UreE [Romeria aff. gracilis LEGE 07310]